MFYYLRNFYSFTKIKMRLTFLKCHPFCKHAFLYSPHLKETYIYIYISYKSGIRVFSDADE